MEKLYRSHSLEYKKDAEDVITSGSLTIWEDSPVSPFNIGDTFQPVAHGPSLTVENISIKDNVIGELFGRPVRQWEITIEGSNETEAEGEQQDTHVKYNFSIQRNEDVIEHSGTMEVENVGDTPSITLNIGDKFSVPGIGEVSCISVKGNDEYDEDGIHRWLITYEGSDAPEKDEDEETLPEPKYNFSIEQTDTEDIHTGSMSIVSEGASPVLDIQVGSSFNVPGIGKVKCTKISGSDDYTENGTHRWTIIYEGTDAEDESSETDPETLRTKYNFSVETNSSGNVIHSGTKSIINIGDNPDISLEIGGTFNIPGIGNVTCTKFSGNDDYSEDGSHKWTVVYEGNNAQEEIISTNASYNFSVEIDSEGNTIHTGSKTVEYSDGEQPSELSVGGKFSIPIVGELTCTKITGNDKYSEDGLHIWTLTYEGTDAPMEDQQTDEENFPEIKYNFSLEGEDEENVVHSGTISIVNEGANPAFDFGIGSNINVPGIGVVKCTKINGSDEYTENGSHIWTVTYEGTDAQSESAKVESLPEIKYSFSIEGQGETPEHTGSMQVVNEGEQPALNLEVGAEFTIPGAGQVRCTKVSGSDEYTEQGTRRWVVTYEGTNKDETSEQAAIENTKYTFNAELSDETVIHTGTKQVIVYGDSPTFAHATGAKFTVPGVGELTCTKYNGSDEFTEDGLHKWTITYEGTDAPAEETEQAETLPQTKYNLAIEKDTDGDIQKSGSMSIVNTGDTPSLDISVGSTFNVPGLGLVTCSKVSGNDDYTEAGVHRWTMTYEGYVNSQSGDEDDPDDEIDTNAKYNFSMEQDTSGSVIHSGSVELTTSGNLPNFAHEVGDRINFPGIGEVTCVKVSGSDNYSDTGKRKWTVTYEGTDKTQEETEHQVDEIKYTLNIEKNSDGVTIYSGTKETTYLGSTPSISVNIGEKFSLPLIGEVTCTRINTSNSDAETWTITLEGSRSGSSGEEGDDEEDASLPETEITLNYELNGTTVRTIAGEFIALRRSETPIAKKNITVYTQDDNAVALPGNSYEGGIVTSVNIVKEVIKNDGVETGSYYKQTLEVEA